VKLGKALEEGCMKATYDRRTDTLSVVLRDDAQVSESDEDKPGVILDYDDLGNLVSIEVPDASRHVSEAQKMEFQTTG
jgi:YD repeat-containing protein